MIIKIALKHQKLQKCNIVAFEHAKKIQKTNKNKNNIRQPKNTQITLIKFLFPTATNILSLPQKKATCRYISLHLMISG